MIATSFDEYSLKNRVRRKRKGENILQMHFLFVKPENKGLKLTFKMIKKVVKGALCWLTLMMMMLMINYEDGITAMVMTMMRLDWRCSANSTASSPLSAAGRWCSYLRPTWLRALHTLLYFCFYFAYFTLRALHTLLCILYLIEGLTYFTLHTLLCWYISKSKILYYIAFDGLSIDASRMFLFAKKRVQNFKTILLNNFLQYGVGLVACYIVLTTQGIISYAVLG